jgi:hypothetical protein
VTALEIHRHLPARQTRPYLASLIETCKLNRVNPQAYFADLLTRLVNGWPQKRIDELMPWNWQPDHPS